jgi:hypothetical protein
MIIIAGDSWGCGEFPSPWSPNVDYKKLIGIGNYLSADGHDVLNISKPGHANFGILFDLTSTLHTLSLQGRLNQITHVFVFQTEWYRDFRVEAPDLESFVKTYDARYHEPGYFDSTFIPSFLSRWQYRLSDLAVSHNLRIGLIGGCSDTMWLDKFEQEYPGLYIACQSSTNLCINDNPRINQPVFAAKIPLLLIDSVKRTASNSDFESLLDQVDYGTQRLSDWKHYPEWFFPDGIHLNRNGHKKLYDYLKNIT